jgi:hypothetical protein
LNFCRSDVFGDCPRHPTRTPTKKSTTTLSIFVIPHQQLKHESIGRRIPTFIIIIIIIIIMAASLHLVGFDEATPAVAGHFHIHFLLVLLQL